MEVTIVDHFTRWGPENGRIGIHCRKCGSAVIYGTKDAKAVLKAVAAFQVHHLHAD